MYLILGYHRGQNSTLIKLSKILKCSPQPQKKRDALNIPLKI